MGKQSRSWSKRLLGGLNSDSNGGDLSMEIVCLIKKAINQRHLELKEGAAENLFMTCSERE